MALSGSTTEATAMPLANPKYELFAQELANGVTATQAYENAGFKPDRGNASRLQQDDRIKQRVAQLLEERARKQAKASEKAVQAMGLSKQWVLGKLVENVERGLQARAVLDDDGKPIGEFKYDGGVVNRALELLGKEQGMFIDRKESGAPGDFAGLTSVEEVMALVTRELGDETAAALAAVLSKQEAEPAESPADLPVIDASRSVEDTLN
jgi:phage terminase small subunit